MTKQIRHHVAALFLLLPAAAALVAVPGTVIAQPSQPELRSLQVVTDDGLRAGAELQFTVEATPRGRVQLNLAGVPRSIVLQETERGVYTGSYTLRLQDRLREGSAVRATLKVRNRTITNNSALPADIGGRNVAVAPPPGLKIDRFSVAPIDKMEPGAELRFTLNGAPGGRADFDIPGVIDNVPMREVSPGVYEGAYTIRRMDNLAPSRPAVATLRVGDRTVSSTLTQPLIADAKPPVIRHVSPRDGETVPRSAATSVSGTFDDVGGVGVDPRDGAAAVPVPPGAEPEVVEPDVGPDEGVLPRGREGGVSDRFCDASPSTGKTGPSWVTGCTAGPAEVLSAGVAPGVHSSGRSSPAVGGVSPTASS